MVKYSQNNNHIFIIIATLFLFALVSITNCSSEQHSQSVQDLNKVNRIKIDNLRLFLNPTNNNINRPSYLEMLPDGRLAVLDPDQKEVHIYKSDGSLDTNFGREGKGPGELVLPRGLEIQDSTINIVDAGLQRVNLYDWMGNFIQNYNIKREASFFGFTAIGDSMEYYTVANGYNGGLIAHRDAETDSVRYFGEAVVKDPPPSTTETHSKKALQKAKCPMQSVMIFLWIILEITYMRI